MASLAPPKEKRGRTSDWFKAFETAFEFDDDGEMVIKPLSDQEVQQIEDLENTLLESENFRVGSSSTHSRLDRHLLEYRKTCAFRLRNQKKMPDDIYKVLLETGFQTAEYDRSLFFLEDRKELFSMINFYLTVMAQQLKPRALADDRPRLTTLTSRRWSILHWLKTYLETPPSFATLQARTNKALFYAVSKFGINTKRREKSYFGRHELRFLIDFDMAHTDAFEVAENHHLAWTMALITGVRPGALGRSKFRNNSYLRWRDIEITRHPEHSSRFNLKITFRYMKGFQDQSAIDSGWNDEGFLRLTVLAPRDADNIPLSPAYRLLAIALKRNILKQYDTVRALLDGQEFNVVVKDDHLDDPVFFAATFGGKSLDTKKAATAKSFTEYLGSRAKQAGFQEATMYSFRRKAATNVDRAAGRAASRMFLNHNPASMTFEKSYEQSNFDLDCGAIAYDEIDQAATLRDANTPVLYRAELVMKPEQLELQIMKYVEMYGNRAAPDYHLQVRRLRKQALAALRQQAREFHRETFTMADLKKRQKELYSSSAFMQTIRNRVEQMEAQKRAFTSGEADGDDDEFDQDAGEEQDEPLDIEDRLNIRLDLETDQDTEEDINVATEDDSADVSNATDNTASQVREPSRVPAPSPQVPESSRACFTNNILTAAGFYANNSQKFRDFTEESQQHWIDLMASYQDARYKDIQPSYGKVPRILETLRALKAKPPTHEELTLDTDNPSDSDRILEIPYDVALSTFFDIMLEGAGELKSGDARQCHECLADDTITEEDGKYKYWENKSKLQRHLASREHSGYQKFIRKTKIAMQGHEKGLASCDDCDKEYPTYDSLGDHLTKLAKRIKDGKVGDTDPHYGRLVSEGWLAPDFKLSRRAASEHDKKLRKLSDIISGRKENVAVPLETARPANFAGLGPAASGRPSPAYVGPVQPGRAEYLKFPEHVRHLPRVTPQSLRQQITDQGLQGVFVDFVDPATVGDSGKQLKERLESIGQVDSVDWGIPRLGDSATPAQSSKGKGKAKASSAGLAKPAVRKF